VGAVAWVVVGGLVLYAKSRGWTTEWERKHHAASMVALTVVLWAAAGSLVLLLVLGAAVAAHSAIAVPWVVQRVLEAIAVAAAGVMAGRLDSLTAARAPFLKGAGALPWAAALGGVALVAFAIGGRSLGGPSRAASN
jgi:hypothetical protein